MTHITSNLDAIPAAGESYAIVTVDSTHVPGDERSRTHPGHGYPEHTVYHPSLQVFTDEAAWKAEIERLAKPASGIVRPFRAFVLTPVSVETAVVVRR